MRIPGRSPLCRLTVGGISPDSVGQGLLSLTVVFSLGYMGKWPRQILKTAY